MPYQIYEEFPREKILPLISKNENAKIQFGEFNVRVGSTRLQTLGKSQKCCVCGCEGVVFRLERSVGNGRGKRKKHKERNPEYRITPHFNLYAIEYIPVKRGSNRKLRRYVLMTRDHIYPRSKGGPDTVDNSQTMCEKCNSRKSDKFYTKYLLQDEVQEMLKNLPVKYPIQLRNELCVNF